MIIRSKLGWLIAVAIFASVVSTPLIAAGAQSEHAKMLVQAKRDMLAILKDPDSAKFRDIKMVGETEIVMGYVNAKNSYGGYNGYKLFGWTKDRGAYFVDEDQ